MWFMLGFFSCKFLKLKILCQLKLNDHLNKYLKKIKVASLEGQHFKSTGKLVSLSEQNLVDCSSKFGNMGCDGGLMDQAFQYIKANKGIDTEQSYPYEAQDGRCRFKPANVGATDTGFTDVTSGDESALTGAIASVGPISVAIDASQDSFQ